MPRSAPPKLPAVPAEGSLRAAAPASLPLLALAILCGCLGKDPMPDKGDGTKPPKVPEWAVQEDLPAWKHAEGEGIWGGTPGSRAPTAIPDFSAAFPTYIQGAPSADGKAGPRTERSRPPGGRTPRPPKPGKDRGPEESGTVPRTSTPGETPPSPVDVPLLLQWRLGTGRAITTSPVSAHGLVYGVVDDGTLYALAADTGQEAWTTPLNGQVVGTPVAAGSFLFVPGMDGTLSVVDARAGGVLRRIPSRAPSGDQIELLQNALPAIVCDPVLAPPFLWYAGHDGVLYRLNVEDHTVASFELPGPVGRGGLVVTDSLIVAACSTGDLVAVRLGESGGESRVPWKVRLSRPGAKAFALPILRAGELVLVATGQDRFLHARRISDGQPVWAATLKGPVTAAVAVEGGRAAVVTRDDAGVSSLALLDLARGDTKWQTQFPGARLGPPIFSSGLIFVGSGGADCALAALDAETGELLWQGRQFSSISTRPLPVGGRLFVTTDAGYLAAYEPCDVLSGNPFLKEGAVGPYVDWEGEASHLRWRYTAWPKNPSRFKYRMTDFSFQFRAGGDAAPWLVISRPMVPLEPFLLGPTYTGLLLPPTRREDRVRVIAVKGIDHPLERAVRLDFPEHRVLTALIVARQFRQTWRPVYVNNFFVPWRLRLHGAADAAIAGYYVGKRRPFDVFFSTEGENLNLLRPFDRAFVHQSPKNAIVHGFFVPRAPKGYQMDVHHCWGQGPDDPDVRLLYGDPADLLLLELHP